MRSRALRLKLGRFVAAESRKVFHDETVSARCETGLKHSGCSISAIDHARGIILHGAIFHL
jgi:hypothetical protein